MEEVIKEEIKIETPIVEKSVLDEIREERTKMEDLAKSIKSEREKIERGVAEMNIRGRSQAGQIPIEQTEQQKAQDAANKLGAVFGMKLYG